MNNIFIGVVAGIIDIAPMIFQKVDKYSFISAFCHWVMLGLLIPCVRWNIQPWLKGSLIAVLTAIPHYADCVTPRSKGSNTDINISVFFGAGVSICGAKFIV